MQETGGTVEQAVTGRGQAAEASLQGDLSRSQLRHVVYLDTAIWNKNITQQSTDLYPTHLKAS